MALFGSLPPSLIAVLAFVGTYCLILAYEKQYHVKKVLQYGRETRGEVVDILQDPWNQEQDMVVVDYQTEGGTFKHYSQAYKRPCPYQLGQEVRIWVWPYKLRHTGRVALPDEQPGRAPQLLLLAGAVMCLLSYPELFRRILLFF